MDTGRISLPSIDCMLNTMSQFNNMQAPPLPPTPPIHTSDANIHSSPYYQQDQRQQHSFVSLPYSSTSSLSTPWKGHSRSHSMDTNVTSLIRPSYPQQKSSLSELETSSLVGSSVSPLHERSTRVSSPASSLQQFGTRSNDTHYQRHSRSTSYTMGMNYNPPTNNVLHNMLGNTPPRKYLCPHCTKSFSRPSSLRTHIFSHSGEKPFACPYQGCNRSFSVQSNMRRHIRVHYSASLASSHSS